MTPAHSPLVARKLSIAACEHVGIDLGKVMVREVKIALPADDLVTLHFEVMVSADDLAKIAEIARGMS